MGSIDVLSSRTVNYYSENAPILALKYNSLKPESLHASWSHFIPDDPGIALDIGAGSGRDANWLASKGWDVVAVEPCSEFRQIAEQNSHGNVIWSDDELPDLKKLRTAGHRFNLILLSAVWMHVSRSKRERAFRIVSELLAPGGILVFTLRHGKDERENLERGFHPVSRDELEQFARQRALAQPFFIGLDDYLNRDHISWEIMVFQLPDDGTGSLPLLRHIIVNDDKSATYKLGLLRTLIRIAEGAAGMAIRCPDDTVEIPFGLVGLYWLKLYIPLVLQRHLVQSPSHKPSEQRGLGFAKAKHFYQLNQLSPYDLRIGAILGAEQARLVIGAINDACNNIERMPATHITFPGKDNQVFTCQRESVRAKKEKFWQINKQNLSQFGVFKIPADLWQCLGQFACWLEPTIVNEWVKLMQGYEIRYSNTVYHEALQWDEGRRNTLPVRERVKELRQNGEHIHCVWTNKKLMRESYEVDHCFPWSRWYNNDLWNLMPTTVQANGQKSEKLPSAPLMHASKGRIIDWWDSAYISGDLTEQFLIEAETALPLVSESTSNLTVIFEALMHQRARLKANQQLVEWAGLNY